MKHAIRRLLPASQRRSGWHVVSAQLLLALIVTLVTGVAVVSYDRMVTGSARRQMQDTADLAEVFLNRQNADVAAMISSSTKAADVDGALAAPSSAASKKVIARILDIISSTGRDIFSVTVTDSLGRVIATQPARVKPGYNLSDRPWFVAASRSRTFQISPVFESVVVKGQYLTTISVPIRLNTRGRGQLLGVVAVAERLDGYRQFVDAYAQSRDVELSVIDGSGAVVASGGAGSFPADADMARRTAIGQGLLIESPSEVMAVSTGHSGGADAAATGDNWRVVAQVPRATALRPVVFFRAVAVGAAIVLLVGGFLIMSIRERARRARADAARHLEQSQSRVRDLANSSPDMLFRLTPDGTVIFASRACRNVFGRDADELVGQSLIPLLAAESVPEVRIHLEHLIRDGGAREFTARTLSGPRRIVECGFRLGLTDDVTEVWGSLRDITDRRSAADQVEQLFRLSHDFMAVIGFDGVLVQHNPVWAEAFELGAEGLTGERFETRFRPEDHERVAIHLARLVEDTTVATFETHYLRGGVQRTLLWTAAADPGRELIYAVGRDITDHKQLQRALAQTRDEALEASRLKSEFVATMSHEIRTPMNGVIGLIDLLLSTRLDATQRRYVEGVRTAGDALLSVINDILDFSKIEAGRLVLDNVDFRLEDVVDDVVTLIRQAAGSKGLELTVEYQTGVPFALNGDPGRLRQILLNLAHNAVKFTEIGGISMLVEPGAERVDGEVSVIFKVTDTGIGIDPARLEELFEPFRQVDEGAARAYGGTGLGLAICRRLAELMSGSISATSRIGHGATFVAELVFAPAAEWGRSVRGNDARGLAILLVDGDEAARAMMATQLTRWGMRPVTAASADEAMELLTQRSAPAGGYDLAVIDLHLPGTDGLALVRQLRAVPALAKLPVIALSAEPGQQLTIDQTADADYGITARLAKPVQQSALFDALTRVGVPDGENRRSMPEDGIGPAVGAGGESAGTPSSRAGEGGPSRRDQPAPPSLGRRENGFHLLLVEDNDINQTVAIGILSQLGYRVDVASDGIEAVSMASGHAYDAILMDCQMPRLDGYAATVELRKRPATRSTPIIAMTAATFAADRQRCFDSGMDDFMAKPVRAATLQATLNRWLQPNPNPEERKRAEPEQVTAKLREAAGSATEQPAQQPAGPTVPVPAQMPPIPAQTPPIPAQTPLPAQTPIPAQTPLPAQTPRVRPATAQSASARAADDGDDPSIAGTQERIAELLGEGSQLEVELVREIITSFLTRTADLFQRLTLAVDADDAEAAHLHAHTLAGAALNLGTVRVVAISRQIEADAKAGRPGQGAALLPDLEVALERARLLLRDIAAGLPDPEPDAATDPAAAGTPDTAEADAAGWGRTAP